MAKIGMLVPRKSMLAAARAAARRRGTVLAFVRAVATPDAVLAAKEAEQAGVQVLAARGLQARLIKQNTGLTVVDIRTTGQEMALLIQQAKTILGGENPIIAVVGFAGSFMDYGRFGAIFGVELRTYTVETLEEEQTMVGRAAAEGAQLIIGGEVPMEAARRLGIPALFNETGEDAMAEALAVAEKAASAIDVEKRAHAQLDTILDVNPAGVVEVDRNHRVTVANAVAQQAAGLSADVMTGMAIEDLIVGVDSGTVEDVLAGRKERASIAGRMQDTHLAVTAAPLGYEGEVSGAVFTLHRMRPLDGVQRQSVARRGHFTAAGFSAITRRAPAVRRCVELARLYALSASPVLLYGEVGTEVELLAGAIHNASGRQGQPFVAVNCFDTSEAAQAAFLFGDPAAPDETARNGALYMANFGTVFISDAQNLAPACQYRLARLIRQKVLVRNNIDKAASLDVRVMCAASGDLAEFVGAGAFRPDLYHLLAAMQLYLPPLRESADDIRRAAKQYMQEYCSQYSKYVELTADAYEYLAGRPWPGNLLQLERFCERLVLGATRRSITAAEAAALLEDTYPVFEAAPAASGANGMQGPGAVGPKAPACRHPEAARIARALERSGGNRQAAAAELGISTTTLWRRMKKHGIIEVY